MRKAGFNFKGLTVAALAAGALVLIPLGARAQMGGMGSGMTGMHQGNRSGQSGMMGRGMRNNMMGNGTMSRGMMGNMMSCNNSSSMNLGAMSGVQSPLDQGRALNLDANQTNELHALRDKFLRQEIDARAQLDKAGVDVQAARRSGDLEKLGIALKARAEAQVKAQLLQARESQESLKVLTPEQQKQWADLSQDSTCGHGSMNSGNHGSMSNAIDS